MARALTPVSTLGVGVKLGAGLTAIVLGATVATR